MIASLESLISMWWVTVPVPPQVVVTEKSLPPKAAPAVLASKRGSTGLPCVSPKEPPLSFPCLHTGKTWGTTLGTLCSTAKSSLSHCSWHQDKAETCQGWSGSGREEAGERSARWDITSEVPGALTALCQHPQHLCSS